MRKFIHILIIVISSILTLCAILSLFRDTEIRYLKMLDFPRIQFFIITLLSLISLWVMTKKWNWYNLLLVSGLVFGLVIHGKFLIHYTSLVAVDVPWAEKNISFKDQLSLLLTNVKMENREAQLLIELVNRKKPDLILAMETDEWWDEQLKVLEKEYPFSKHTINDVAYGMILFSKFPLEDVEVEYLNNENVPSFDHYLTHQRQKTDASFYPSGTANIF
ncbi:Endonuclease/Exonuclease/phosphatase family protein [Algoriphagus ratkowskyi]|uniref:Endonuclease/Exonuclease/phosphatase family protein n=1 Tax=Algoriphagus ratkowskyi TaxID=57028 RepID=A0A2W7RK22_9BACT|nr:endonuclease/exonuclease/phosphatase family protein [Algoriphagus ratkowskyi]PZX55927.1 Endonuclease/Exonuclease/phosphatase family protein [Algoriphagus ratkowskyi]